MRSTRSSFQGRPIETIEARFLISVAGMAEKGLEMAGVMMFLVAVAEAQITLERVIVCGLEYLIARFERFISRYGETCIARIFRRGWSEIIRGSKIRYFREGQLIQATDPSGRARMTPRTSSLKKPVEHHS
jgi:hypothetical protein